MTNTTTTTALSHVEARELLLTTAQTASEREAFLTTLSPAVLRETRAWLERVS